MNYLIRIVFFMHAPFLLGDSRLCTSFQELKQQIALELENGWNSRLKIEMAMDLIYEIKPEVCVEVGAFTGSFLLPIAATLKFLKICMIYKHLLIRRCGQGVQRYAHVKDNQYCC